MSAAASIGPDAVAYTEEKLGGLRDFLDGQRQTTIFNIEENGAPTSKVCTFLEDSTYLQQSC
jgi:hypothetical protein